MNLIPMAISQGLSGAQQRNNGQQSGLLGGHGAIDGSMQSFWNLLDPANLTGNASSGHILSNIFDPGNVLGMNQAANPNGPNGQNGGAGNSALNPTQIPTLGGGMTGQIMSGIDTPKFYGSNFAPPQLTGGAFNRMAQAGAGPVYMPSLIQPQPTVSAAPPSPSSVPAPLLSSGIAGGLGPRYPQPYRGLLKQQ